MSVCEASIGGYDGDPVKVWHDEWRTARKPRVCYECGASIAVGCQHRVVKLMYDGVWSAYRICAGCWDIHQEFSDGGVDLGVLWENMCDQVWGEGSHILACLGRVPRVVAKRKLREQWIKWKGLDGMDASSAR